MSLINKLLKSEENKEKNDTILNEENKNNNHNYSFTNDNKLNIISFKIREKSLNINVCIKEIDENKQYKSILYYSKFFKYKELLKISDIFKIYSNSKDIENFLNKIFSNQPLIKIEENNIKLFIKEMISYSFIFDLPKVDKMDFEKEKENENILINKENDLIIEKTIDLYIEKNIKNSELDENNQLKKRILALEEKQKLLTNIFEEMEKEKENKIKILEDQLIKIKEKIKNEEINSQIFFNENLKKGLNGKTESILPFKNLNNDSMTKNINLFEGKNNEIKSNQEKILLGHTENKNQNDSNYLKKKSGFFKSIHKTLKRHISKDIDNNAEIEEENYLYSNSENEIVDDIQFFEKENSKLKLFINEKDLTPNDSNIYLGNKRINANKDINLSFSRKSEENSSDEIYLDSKIALYFEDYEFIINYLRNELNLDIIKVIKIFRASEDGDKAQKFHTLCDNTTNIIILIRTKEKKKFGGFSSKGFNSNNRSIIDNSAFIFTLDKKQIYRVKENNDSIFCYENYGPSFTQGFSVPDKFLSNISYTFPKDLNFTTKEDYEINNGNKYFQIEELEVLELLIHD